MTLLDADPGQGGGGAWDEDGPPGSASRERPRDDNRWTLVRETAANALLILALCLIGFVVWFAVLSRLHYDRTQVECLRHLPRQPGPGHRAYWSPRPAPHHRPDRFQPATSSRHRRSRAEHPGNRPDQRGIPGHHQCGARGRPRAPARHANARPARRQRDLRPPHRLWRTVQSATIAARGGRLYGHHRARGGHLPCDRPAPGRRPDPALHRRVGTAGPGHRRRPATGAHSEYWTSTRN